MLLVGRQEGHPACKKTEWWGAGMVICLEWGADLHLAQLMPLPLIVSCFSKIQIGFTFLVPAHLGSPGKRAVKWVCVCVCVSTLEALKRASCGLSSVALETTGCDMWQLECQACNVTASVQSDHLCNLPLRETPDSSNSARMLECLLTSVSLCSKKLSAFKFNFDSFAIFSIYMYMCLQWLCLQCFDTVGWAAGRAFGL